MSLVIKYSILENIDMRNVLIKLPKSQTSFSWDKYISSNCENLEIIANSLVTIEDRFLELTCFKKLSINSKTLTKLPDSLYQMETLETLKIKGSIEIKIKNDSQFRKLKLLQLAKLKLSSIPDWIAKQTNLENLDLHGNTLIDLPKEFSNLKKLKRLNLDSNSFTTLPWELEELSSLNHLSIDGNCFDLTEKERIKKVLNISF